MPDWERIAIRITEHLGRSFQPQYYQDVGGGGINRAVRIGDAAQSFFVKLNRAEQLDMFAAEAAGLQALAASGAIRVPEPLIWGEAGDYAFLVLEDLGLGSAPPGSAAQLGRDLAAVHKTVQPRYGWQRDNTIGTTRQCNDWRDDWLTFFREQRLGFQLEEAARNGYGGRLQRPGERLLARLPEWLGEHTPDAALLHGDLWGGNWGALADGTPVIFDPAVYYGDRETDLAMTELFGGFPAAFYSAYSEAYPLDAGYARRKPLYQLYHILNHANLFGGGYVGRAESLMQRLLRE